MNYYHSAPVLSYALRWYSMNFNHSNAFFIGMTSMHQQCQSQITHIRACRSLSLSLCVSPISTPPPCSAVVHGLNRSSRSLSYRPSSYLHLSVFISSFSLPVHPPPSLPPSHSPTPDAKGKWTHYSKRLVRTARQKLILFCFHLLVCLFMPSIRFLIMTLPRDRSHMCWDLSGVWSGIGTLPPHTH